MHEQVEEHEEEVIVPPASTEETTSQRRSNQKIFEDDVLRNYYKVKFKDLVMKERKRRELKLEKVILWDVY